MNAAQVWQSQAIDAPRISLEFVRLQANRLERRTRIVNGINHVGGVVTLGYFFWHAWHSFAGRPLALAAAGCFALAAVFYGIWWWRNASVLRSPGDAGVLDMIRFQRRQLERQRDARRGNWKWSLPPMLPGFAFAFASALVEAKPVVWTSLLGWVLVFSVGLASFSLWYEYTARRLQAEIDALDSLSGSHE